MDLDELKKSVIQAIQDAKIPEALEEIRVHYLGRKGEITAILRSLGELPLEERRKLGPIAQAAKREIEKLLDEKKSEFAAPHTLHPAHSIDLTAPGKKRHIGHLHPLTKVEQEIRKIFLAMNFSVVDGPEMETEHYNFDALNIPPNHPARDMWDTFWLRQNESKEQKSRLRRKASSGQAKTKDGGKLLLRTHTSPMQIRYMEQHQPPFQIIVPGRVFRYEAIDMNHEINFYHVEGLMVDKEISVANFKFVIEEFFRRFFKGQKVAFRYRPSYFPFVEPGLEVDILFKGKWLEMMGAGMVHPHVFESAHYNPREWQGFAFGIGVDRLAMVKYNIPDIRLFYSGDLRFIRQF